MKLSFKKLNEIPKFIWLAFTSTYLRYSKLGCHSNLSKPSYRNRCLHCTLLLVTSPYLICFTSIPTFLLFYCTTHTSLVSIMEGASKQIWRGRDRKKIIDLPGRRTNDPSPGETLLSSVPPSSYLTFVSDPWQASCVASWATEIQGHHLVWCAKRGGPRTPTRTAIANLVCAFVKPHMFSKFIRMGSFPFYLLGFHGNFLFCSQHSDVIIFIFLLRSHFLYKEANQLWSGKRVLHIPLGPKMVTPILGKFSTLN